MFPVPVAYVRSDIRYRFIRASRPQIKSRSKGQRPQISVLRYGQADAPPLLQKPTTYRKPEKVRAPIMCRGV